MNTASCIPSSRLISVCRGHVNDGGFPGSRCLPSWETAPCTLAGASRFALPRLAGRRNCRAPSSLCKTATRPLSRPLSRGGRGRTRSHDLCRWMSPRARLWTARASRTAESAGGTTAMLRPEVAFQSGQPPEVLEVRGRVTEFSTFAVAIARDRDFAPTPIAPGTFRRETPSPAGLERHGGRAALPAARTLARRVRRQGGGAREIREDARRSPARGAFCHRDVRERTIAVREPKPTDRVPAPFSPSAPARGGTPAHTRPGSAKSAGSSEQAHRPSTRRSAPE